MKRFFLSFMLLAGMLLFSACVHKPFQCTDPIGCVTVGNKADIKIGVLLTLSGPQSATGMDALRGIKIAMSDKGQVFGHSVQLVQQDDHCSQSGGQAGAQALAADKQIVGVIGATCSASSQAAAGILSDAGYVMISPSGSQLSLTDPHAHPLGFLRTAYNDGNQATMAANFAYKVLGINNMVTVSDTSDGSSQLALATCQSFVGLGGKCSTQVQLAPGQDASSALQSIASAQPGVIFMPVDPAVGTAIANGLSQIGLADVALIASYNLMNQDFISKTQPNSSIMYFTSPVPVKDPQAFLQKYKDQFGENPIASDHLQAYDAATLLFAAIERVALPISSIGNDIAIPRQALRTALYSAQNTNGLSGQLACKPTGDCAQTATVIYQFTNGNFVRIFP